MPYLVLTTFRPGLQKISLTRAIQAHAGLSLSAAKACTDRYLDGEEVVIEVPSRASAETLREAVLRVGAVAEIRETAG